MFTLNRKYFKETNFSNSHYIYTQHNLTLSFIQDTKHIIDIIKSCENILKISLTFYDSEKKQIYNTYSHKIPTKNNSALEIGEVHLSYLNDKLVIKLKETDDTFKLDETSTFKKLLKACYVSIDLSKYNTTDIALSKYVPEIEFVPEVTPGALQIVSSDGLSTFSITSGTKYLPL